MHHCGAFCQRTITASKAMLAEWFKGITFRKVHVVRNGNGVGSEFDDVQGIFLGFSASTASRSRSATLCDNHATIPMRAWIEVERVADVRSVKVSAQNQFHAKVGKPCHRAFGFGHDAVLQIVGCWRKVVMSDHDSDGVIRGLLKNAGTVIQL
jgi:hypothetical protein